MFSRQYDLFSLLRMETNLNFKERDMTYFSKNVFRTITMSAIFLIYSSVFAQWQCPTSCSCSNNQVSVTCPAFGAIPNDDIGDASAIQLAINSVPDNWTVYFPAGRYKIDTTLEINRSNVNLLGVGTSSELYTPQNTNFILMSVPGRNQSQGCPRVVPKNIRVEQLSFSGDVNRGTEACPVQTDTGCSLLFGLFILNGEDVSISDVLFKDFGLEGLLVGNGTATPKNIMIQRIKTQRFRRNAIHIGYGENITVQDSVFEDSNDSQWLPAGSSGNAIDVETEGLDLLCNPVPGQPHTYRVPYVYDINIKNNLIKSPTKVVSQGGIQLGASYGPIRKANVSNNVLLNSGGIISAAVTYSIDDWDWFHDVDPKVGKSMRNRDLDISSNWISNLHLSGDIATSALTVYASGNVPDYYGTNGVKINDNILTTYQNGGNNLLFQFSANKEVLGNNNKTYRYYSAVNDPLSGGKNFLWRKDVPYFLPSQTPNYDNQNMQILNTVDNGWEGSRLVCYTPVPYTWEYCNSIGGTGNSLTWVNNPNPTPTISPTITSVRVLSPLLLSVGVARNFTDEPVRLEVLHNGLPIGIRDVTFQGTNLTSSANIILNKKAKRGDVFEVMAFSQTGKSKSPTIYTY
jgi:hypothetical protein